MERIKFHKAKPSNEGDRYLWHFYEGWKKPVIECPECGGLLLGDTAPHRIESNGDVNASVVCSHPGCTFHAFIHLEEWTHGFIS